MVKVNIASGWEPAGANVEVSSKEDISRAKKFRLGGYKGGDWGGKVNGWKVSFWFRFIKRRNNTLLTREINTKVMLTEAKELLFYPDIFFSKKAGEKINLVVPALIVLIGSVVQLVSWMFFDGMITPANILRLVSMPFIAWFIISGFLFVICRVLSGSGSFIATLQNAGYGTLPLSFGLIFDSISNFFRANFHVIPLVYELMISSILMLLFIFWSGWLWANAMKKTHAISYLRAVIAASVVVVLYIGNIQFHWADILLYIIFVFPTPAYLLKN